MAWRGAQPELPGASLRRVSLGVQTFVEEELKYLRRPSDPEMPRTASADKLTKNGYKGYYGDCFAKPGHQPKYGETSWSEDVPIIPSGPTATGQLRDHWYFNEPDIGRELDLLQSDKLTV